MNYGEVKTHRCGQIFDQRKMNMSVWTEYGPQRGVRESSRGRPKQKSKSELGLFVFTCTPPPSLTLSQMLTSLNRVLQIVCHCAFLFILCFFCHFHNPEVNLFLLVYYSTFELFAPLNIWLFTKRNLIKNRRNGKGGIPLNI